MAIIAKYKFNPSVYADYLPNFDSHFTGYTKIDVNNGDGTITRTISHDTLKPTYMQFGTNSTQGNREKSLLEVMECDTSEVTNMVRMFQECKELTSLNTSSFNTSNVTTMHGMFVACEKLTSLDLSNFNTGKVTTMFGMFQNCSSLTSLDVSNFNTSSVTNMAYMFYGCSSLTSLDVSSFNTSNVTNMANMFHNCNKLTSLDLSSFNTSSVTNMQEMFRNCSSLTSLNTSSFNTSSVTNMNGMFYGCSSSDIGLLYASSSTINSLLTELGTSVARNIYYTDAPLDELTVQDNITYKEYKIMMATFPYTLNKLPNGVADYIDVVNKVHVQRVGRIVLDGTQTFTYSSQHSNAYYYGYTMVLSTNKFEVATSTSYGLCDKLEYQRNVNFLWTTNGDYIIIASNQLFIKLSKDRLNSNNTVESLNAYLQSNPITVLYELATPIYTPLTEEEIAQLPLSAYADGSVNLSSDQLMPSFEFRMRASNRYQVDMLETGYYYLNAPLGNVKLGTANVDVQQMPCIIKVDNVGTGDSAYRLGLGGEITDTTQITLAKLPSHRIPTTFTQGMRCATDFGYWEGVIDSQINQISSNKTVIPINLILRRKDDIADELDIATGKLIRKLDDNRELLTVPSISYLSLSSNNLDTNMTETFVSITKDTGYLNPQVKPSHLTYPVPSLVGNRTYTVVHNRKNINGSTKPIELNLGGTVVQLNDASSKTLVKTPSTLAHSNLIFIGGESTVDHIMVLDGDWTNKPIEYFENMKGHDTDAIITIIGDGKIDDVAEQYL